MLNAPGKPTKTRLETKLEESRLTRTSTRGRSSGAPGANRRRMFVVSGAIALALTPVLAMAASQAHGNGLVMGAIWLSFVAMVATVVAMWRRFARDMLSSLHPKWEDWK